MKNLVRVLRNKIIAKFVHYKRRVPMIKKVGLFICFSLIFYLNLYPSSEKNYFIIGNEEEDGLLIYPWHVKEGLDGNIYVYDRSDAFIKVYSPEGKYLRRIGGKGQGPGEIQRADGANFGFTHDGKLYFTESFGGHRWITLMEMSGEFHKAFHLEIKEMFGIVNSSPLNDGGFLVELWLGSRPEKKKDYFLYRYPEALVRVDSVGKIVAEIIKTDYFKTISSVGDGADQWLPFIPVFTWIPFKEDSVIFSDGLSRNLKVYDYEGGLIREIKTMLPEPEKVKGKDLDEWIKMRKETFRDKSWFNRFGRVIEKYKKSIYDKKPNLNGISSTPDGNILVSGTWSEGEKTNYWLLDENGKTLAQASLDSLMLRISKHFIVFRTTDEEGNYLIICLKRRGTEKEDLLRIKNPKILEKN